MKTKVYEVEFYEKWSYQDQNDESDVGKDVMVVSAKSAEEAIEKVRKHVMKQSFKDDEEPSKTHRVVGFELCGLTLKETLDL